MLAIIAIALAHKSIGGGGGNRTRVRRPSTVRTTCLAWFFNAFALRPPTGRLTLG